MSISITAIASISPLGSCLKEAWQGYGSTAHCFTQQKFNGQLEWVATLPKEARAELVALRHSDAKYKNLDDTVLLAIYASRKAIASSKWNSEDNFGINIGSSRGATALFEKYHQAYLQDGKTATLSSPTTTLGNISSWVAHDLQTNGPEISHSITCSTGLHAVLNGVAWIKSGMARKFLVGGSEAPLTPFTIAQMKALKIYARSNSNTAAETYVENPCRALDLDKSENTMILGEGASVACLEHGAVKNALAIIKGVGYATEVLRHNVSISTDARCFQRSMQMALGDLKPEQIDAIVMHAPGTVKGDLSEFEAIKKVFCNKRPFLTTNKWKVGHTFGTSGMLSLELAILMIQYQKPISAPYYLNDSEPKEMQHIMINAVGFGGNAVSVLLSK